MKTTLILLYLALAIFTSDCALGQLPANRWAMTVKVVGEDGAAVVGADVCVSYSILPPPHGSNQKTYGEIKGLTDMNGIFSASHMDSSLGLAVTVIKSGYYATHMGHELYMPGQFDMAKVVANRNTAITLVLKKIGKPIPMYAKHMDLNLDGFSKTGPGPFVFQKTAGYDLMVGDWVTPYGKGRKTDIIFTREFSKRANNDYDDKLIVFFPNPGDGIKEFNAPSSVQEGVSELKSSHEAPVDGYESQWLQTNNRKPGKPLETNRDPHRNYLFRVQTKVDDRGNIVSTHYGKIYGDFMQFSYYLNPTPNDRNVEFDPAKNLIKNLKPLEEVKEP